MHPRRGFTKAKKQVKCADLSQKMNQEQLVRHFSTTNSIGLQSHCGDVDTWAQGQMALLKDEMVGLRGKLAQCYAEAEAQKDTHELATSIAFRRGLLQAFIRSTQEVLGADSEYNPELAGWVAELGDMEPSITKINTFLETNPPSLVIHVEFQ